MMGAQSRRQGLRPNLWTMESEGVGAPTERSMGREAAPGQAAWRDKASWRASGKGTRSRIGSP